MSQNKELNTNQSEKKEIQIDRVFCYLDSQIPLKFDVLAKYFTKKLSASVVSIKSRLDQRTFLQQIDQINNKDFFVFFIKIVNVEQINELFGKWKKISENGAKFLFIIFDCSAPSFRGVSDDLPTQRYLEMSQDKNTKIILLGRDKLSAETLDQAVDQITKD